MVYSQRFSLKNSKLSNLANSSKIDASSRGRGEKSFWQGLGGVSESLEEFPGLNKSPGFLLKNCQFSTLANSPEIDTDSIERNYKSFSKGYGLVSESLEEFRGLAKIRFFKTVGYCPDFLLKNCQFSTFANSPKIDTNRYRRS